MDESIERTAELGAGVSRLARGVSEFRRELIEGDEDLDVSLAALRQRLVSIAEPLGASLPVPAPPGVALPPPAFLELPPPVVLAGGSGIGRDSRSALLALAAQYGVDPKFGFSSWNKADVVAVVVAGAAGGLLSLAGDSGTRLHDGVTQYGGHDSAVDQVFGHSGDLNDAIPVDVGALGVPRGIHRLFAGHDFLQFAGDKNIVLLLTEQYGLPVGMVKAIIHPFYDLFSAQGLPLPGTSNFAETLYVDWCDRSTSVYEQFFTLHASDIVGTGLTGLLLWAYRKADAKYWCKRPVQKDYRFYEMNMAAYAMAAATTGICTQTLNWPAVTWVVKNLVGYLRLQGRVTKQLRAKVMALKDHVGDPDAGLPAAGRVREMDEQFDALLKEE